MFNDENFEVTPVCSNCKHANLYIPYWTYPYGNPKCEISMNNIEPDDSCEFFKPIGWSKKSMISKDCKNCEYLDIENNDYPCKLDNHLRCTILKEFVKRESWKKELGLE